MSTNVYLPLANLPLVEFACHVCHRHTVISATLSKEATVLKHIHWFGATQLHKLGISRLATLQGCTSNPIRNLYSCFDLPGLFSEDSKYLVLLRYSYLLGKLWCDKLILVSKDCISKSGLKYSLFLILISR